MGTNHEDTHINESILSEEILEDQKKNRIDHMTYLPGMEDIGSEILDQVVTAMEAYDYNTYTAEDVKRALAHAERTPEDFQALLSPAALPFLEEIAQAAQIETRKHFGNSVYMFTPIYIANYCENYCIYCGFNCHNKINRAQLNAEEIEKEMAAIAETGLQEILILTGESRNKSTVEYIGEACKIARKYFKVIGLEVYPVNSDEYAYLHECGADYVTVFQETYNSDKYETLHLAGHKRIYPYRVNAQERALKGGMRGVGFAALLEAVVGQRRSGAGEHGACKRIQAHSHADEEQVRGKGHQQVIEHDAHAAEHEGLFAAQEIGRHAAGHLAQEADDVEHTLGKADLPEGKAPGRQQCHPHGIGDAQAGKEIIGI